ncbi:hypothetical protein [Geothrix sp. SG200]|uniref:hypothetical protein n=1 Tax=Geothrix sp. SG200 TaxID=2922865 RepID=UPI001FAE034F|nr:hypothetical protein [Geothrix sp. SG200]
MRIPGSPRNREKGGIAILLALVLLTLMGAMIFGLGRDSLREISITGNESLGRKASEAADSGIDWTIMWGLGNGASPDQAAIHKAIDDLSKAIADPTLRTSGIDGTLNTQGTGYMNKDTGVLRAYIYPASTTSDLSFSNAGYTQSSVVQQAMELEVRYLGPYPLANTGALTAGKASGGGATGAQRYFFLVRSTGRANVGATGQSFVARRDAIVDITF